MSPKSHSPRGLYELLMSTIPVRYFTISMEAKDAEKRDMGESPPISRARSSTGCLEGFQSFRLSLK